MPFPLAGAVGLSSENYGEINDKIKAFYYLPMSWICTDTRVGLCLYTDRYKTFLGYSIQPARKSPEEFYWYNQSSIEYIRKVLLDSVFSPQYCPNIEIDIDSLENFVWLKKYKTEMDRLNKKNDITRQVAALNKHLTDLQ